MNFLQDRSETSDKVNATLVYFSGSCGHPVTTEGMVIV